jgi:peptidoglycan/xylan/chitin deacetylase (PgdA/CDA1 family)
VSLLHHPRVRRLLSAYLLCEVPHAGPRFALTFDDGPSPRNTAALLDVLERHGARATFFLLAHRARRHADLVRRAVDRGHEIAVHGDLHVPGWGLPRPWFDRDVAHAVAAVSDVAGYRPIHYRAPFGFLFPAQARWARGHGLTAVLGSIYPKDHAVRSPGEIARRVLERLTPGAIVILHDSSALGDPDRGATIGAVDTILADAARRGLAGATIREMVGLE